MARSPVSSGSFRYFGVQGMDCLDDGETIWDMYMIYIGYCFHVCVQVELF